MSASMDSILQRLESVAGRLESCAGAAEASGAASAVASAVGAASAGAGGSEDSPIAQSLDVFLQAKLTPLEAAAKETGSKEVIAATEAVAGAHRMLRDIVAATGSSKKPQDKDWQVIFKPVMEIGQKAHKACDNRNDFFQAQKAGAEATNVVSLVTQTATAPHVKGVFETCDFHLVKVMQKKNPAETAWAKALKDLLQGLEAWCLQEIKMGLTWSQVKGQDAAVYFAAHPVGSGGPAGGGTAAEAPAAPKAGGGMASVFGAIQGKDAGGLKKVSDDMKAKNRPKEDVAPPAPAPKAKAAAKSKFGTEGQRKGPKGPPIQELQREVNWMFENLEGVSNLVVDDATMKHNVIIINCREVTIQVKPKVKSIQIDGCEKVNVICGDVLSTVEFVNSDRCKVQTIGKISSVAIDKCNGVNVFLSKDSLGAEIVSSKSSEMNVTIPDPDGDEADIIEMPIPEQFVTKVTGPKKLTTEVSGLYS